jgi:hypothetical protein
MAVLKPRERLVYFRISEDEFRQFVSVCEQEGARSVSDLARSAVQRLITTGDRQREGEVLADKMERLEALIAAVTEQLEWLRAARAWDASMVPRTITRDGCADTNSAHPNARREE